MVAVREGWDRRFFLRGRKHEVPAKKTFLVTVGYVQNWVLEHGHTARIKALEERKQNKRQ